MDRTKEFCSLVKYSNIPQNPYKKAEFFIKTWKVEQEIISAITQLEKLTFYESFKFNSLLAACKEQLNTYKSIELEEIMGKDGCIVLENFKSLINTRFLKYTLKLNELKRNNEALKRKAEEDRQKNIQEQQVTKEQNQRKFNQPNSNNSFLFVNEENSNEPKPLQQSRMQDSLLIQEEETNQEFKQERRRIVKTISEIGQIVEDISIHVRLQEEQLKRIDDITIESDKWTKKAFVELNDVWKYVAGNRKSMVKFFCFWIFIIIIFWIVRRS